MRLSTVLRDDEPVTQADIDQMNEGYHYPVFEEQQQHGILRVKATKGQ